MIFVIGEILFDIFPKFKRLGGAPFNFAFHLKHLGFPVRFISRIGNDANGRKILERIAEAGFDPEDVQRDETLPTGTVQVALDSEGVPTFDIVPNVAYDHIEFIADSHSEALKHADLVYFGTLAQRTDHGFEHIQKFLRHKGLNAVSFYDINLRPKCYSAHAITESLYNTNILKLNTGELNECYRVCKIDQGAPSPIRQLMADYSLDTVALTQGDSGSELYTRQGVSRHASRPVERIADTVGAGDAYAAMLVVGILKKWPPQKSLSMATAFASRICTIDGAIPDSAEFYEPIRKQIHTGG